MRALMEGVAAGLQLTLDASFGSDDLYRMYNEEYKLIFRVIGNGSRRHCRITTVWIFGADNHVLVHDYLSPLQVDGLKTEIKVSLDKSFDAIVKDIKRRLIPAIQKITPILREAVERHLTKVENRQQNFSELLDAASGFDIRRSEGSANSFRIYSSKGASGSIRVIDDLACNAELNSIPVSVMSKILKLLAEENCAQHVDQKRV